MILLYRRYWRNVYTLNELSCSTKHEWNSVEWRCYEPYRRNYHTLLSTQRQLSRFVKYLSCAVSNFQNVTDVQNGFVGCHAASAFHPSLSSAFHPSLSSRHYTLWRVVFLAQSILCTSLSPCDWLSTCRNMCECRTVNIWIHVASAIWIYSIYNLSFVALLPKVYPRSDRVQVRCP